MVRNVVPHAPATLGMVALACRAIYSIGDDQMCAGYDAGGVDVCSVR